MSFSDYRYSHTEPGKGKAYADSFTQKNYRNYIWEKEKRILSKIIDQYSDPQSKALDFACGTGRVLSILNKSVNSVYGIDISSEMIKIAQTNNPSIKIYNHDITKDSSLFEKSSFDVITCFRFILNAQSSLRVEALDALNDIIADTGVFIVNNHNNATSMAAIFGKTIVWIKNLFRNPDDRYIFNTLSHSQVKSLLHKANFHILKTYHLGFFPIINEKAQVNESRLNKFDAVLRKIPFIRRNSRYVIYVCGKDKRQNP